MVYSNWFPQNPAPNPGFMQKLQWGAHTWGRQQFAKSFARGGMAATVFAPNRKEMLLSPWRTKARPGSASYINNLQKLHKLHPNDPGIKKALAGAAKGAPIGIGGALLGAGLVGGMIAVPALTTQGPIEERFRAITKGVGSLIGWEVGSKTGMGIGAAVGSFIPVLGTGIGAAVGYIAGGLLGDIAGGELTEALTRIPDRMVEKERKRRNFEWGIHTAAFQTQKAATMRQQSLQMMQQGQMSARSLLGREAVFVHR